MFIHFTLCKLQIEKVFRYTKVINKVLNIKQLMFKKYHIIFFYKVNLKIEKLSTTLLLNNVENFALVQYELTDNATQLKNVE